MSLIEPVQEYLKNQYEFCRWFWRHSSFINLLFMPYKIAMRRERGTDFPYYFPEEAYFVKKLVVAALDKFDNFVHYHELERNKDGDYNKTFPERFSWVLNNFHYYSNDTMANLYFSKKLPDGDYTKLKNLYNSYALLFLGYNSLTGVGILAMTNFFFRNRKVSLPLVFVASLTSTAAISANFQLSYKLCDSMFNYNVRRLGYKGLIHRYMTHFPRNVDFTYY
jgi:hypothetical protein